MNGELFDLVLGLLMVGIGMVLRRFWHLTDELRQEDKKLHSRITELSLVAVGREEVQKAIDRVLTRIDKLEERLFDFKDDGK